jgi:hypothetical protein
VIYELSAEVYAPKDEASIEYPREMERSFSKRSIVQASLGGCLDVDETSSIKPQAPSLHVGVQMMRLLNPDTELSL